MNALLFAFGFFCDCWRSRRGCVPIIVGAPASAANTSSATTVGSGGGSGDITVSVAVIFSVSIFAFAFCADVVCSTQPFVLVSTNFFAATSLAIDVIVDVTHYVVVVVIVVVVVNFCVFRR